MRAGSADVSAPLGVRPLCGPTTEALFSRDLDVARLAGRGALALPAHGRLRALTVVRGAVEVRGSGGVVTVSGGRTAVIAARADVTVASEGVHAILSSVAAI